MSISKIAVRYAKALFLSAKEHEVLDKVRHDMELLLEVSTGDNEIRNMLESPIVKSSKKFQALSSVFAGRIGSLSLDFLNLVTRNKREDSIPDMCRHYLLLYKEEKGIMQASIRTASHIPESTRKEIIEMVKKAFKAEIELEEEVNKDIIGGFVLRVENQQLDASVKGKLNRIKKELQA
jgi:F-type H+-transporting ATPase subunit delta